MLNSDDINQVKDRYGADDEQIARDHLISHLLGVLSEFMGEQVRFYGGTALSRSFLPLGRLSEDIDLIAVGDRNQTAQDLQEILDSQLARQFGRPTFTPPIASTNSSQPSVISFPSGVKIQIQVLPRNHYPDWPFEMVELEQRYSDAKPAVLSIPTRAAFVAWKTTTFFDRIAPRDLWDLATLATQGAFNSEAVTLYKKYGFSSQLPTSSTFPLAPLEANWIFELSHQTQLTITAEQARETVIRAWNDALHL